MSNVSANGTALTKARRRDCAASEAKLVLPTIGVDEIFAPLPPRPWICERLAIEVGTRPTLIVGDWDVGKSKVVYSLIVAAAAGIRLFGTYAIERTSALLLDGEVGNSTRAQLHRLARGAQLGPEDLRNRLRVAIHPPLKLGDPDAERILRATCRGFGLVAVDSITAFAGELDESSPALGKKLLMLGQIASDLGSCFILLHHTNVRGGIRGSTSIPAGCENIWIVEGDGPCRARMQHERSPDGEKREDVQIEIVDVELDGDRKAGLAVRLREGASQNDREHTSNLKPAIIDLLQKEGPQGGTDRIAKRLGVQAQKVRRAMSELIDEGTVRKTGNGPATRHSLSVRA